jgi:uncharacterized RDD family membrane protein YckC
MVNTDPDLTLSGAAGYSGFLRRFGAWCVDAPIRFAISLALVYSPMRLLVLGQAKRYGSTDPHYLWSMMPFADRSVVFALWLLAAAIIPWLYTALQECSTQQATFGKRLFGIRVTDLEGCPISFGRASERFFARLIPSFGIGYCMALFTRRRQARHDLIAGCVVARGAIKKSRTA